MNLLGNPDDEMVTHFYDDFAESYHLVYSGQWRAGMERQAAALDRLIQQAHPGAASVLDCSCGIGTQAIGLARLGYRVVGSDISAGALARARREAESLGADVTFVQADFRDLGGIPGTFDAVVSCDNAVPHLLDPQDLPRTLSAMRAKLADGGLLVITMRDFDQALLTRSPSTSPPIVLDGSPRQVLVRLHEWEPVDPLYTVRYLILIKGKGGWSVQEHSMRYRAITRDEVTRAATAAGFRDVEWPTESFVVAGQRVMNAVAM